jgi:hypothetical protein
MVDPINAASGVGRVAPVVWMTMFALVSVCGAQALDNRSVLDARVDENTAVRIFYQPAAGDYFHEPLVFRVVRADDPKMGKSEVAEEGRLVFVHLSEMQSLLRALARSEASWRQSSKAEAFGSSHRLRAAGYLEITVVSQGGTATGTAESKGICGFLAKLDGAFTSPRALWEFQKFRWDDNCEVPGFNNDRFPDHYDHYRKGDR